MVSYRFLFRLSIIYYDFVVHNLLICTFVAALISVENITMLDLIDKLRLRENSKRALWLNMGLIGLFSVLILLLFFYVYLPVTTHHGDTITVPDLTGMKIAELEEFLDDKELRYIVDDSNYVEGKVPLSVLVQDPVAGSKVKVNRRIHLTINSMTPPLEKIPEVIDVSMKQVTKMLQGAGFKIGEQKYVEDMAANVVIRIGHKGKYYTKEDVRRGILLPRGSVIDFEIGDGLGKDSFEMPNVVGKSMEEAEVILRGSGLSVNINQETQSTQPAGTVIKQRPEAQGQSVKIGMVVDIWVAGN